jgi:hypothetical protein
MDKVRKLELNYKKIEQKNKDLELQVARMTGVTSPKASQVIKNSYRRNVSSA